MMIEDRGKWYTPSKLVDQLWHRHMLDTKKYAAFCQRVAGYHLHHTPYYGEPSKFESWVAELRGHDPGGTLEAYQSKWAEAPPVQIWGTKGESGGGCGGGGGGGGGGECAAAGTAKIKLVLAVFICGPLAMLILSGVAKYVCRQYYWNLNPDPDNMDPPVHVCADVDGVVLVLVVLGVMALVLPKRYKVWKEQEEVFAETIRGLEGAGGGPPTPAADETAGGESTVVATNRVA
jgi:hypothetical protein